LRRMGRAAGAKRRPAKTRGLRGAQAIQLKVPFYKQTAEFSCGPASVAMAYSYFRPRARLDRDLEFHLWRDTHLPMLYGATRFGIAVAVARSGLGAHIISATEGLGFAEQTPRIIHIPARGMKFFGIAQWRSAAQLGVTEEKRDPTLEDIRAVLRAGGLPILFVSTRVFDDDDIPHWIVVSGVRGVGDTTELWLNNPLDSRPGRLPASKVLEGAEFFGERGLVAVFRGAAEARRFSSSRRPSRVVRAPPLPKRFFGEADMEFRSPPGVRVPGIRPSLMDETAEFKRKARAAGRRKARRILEMWASQSP